MYRVALSVVRDHALAEDVVQESVVKAWQAPESFRGEASVRAGCCASPTTRRSARCAGAATT